MQYRFHIDHIAILNSFMDLKVSRLEDFLTIKLSGSESSRALKRSRFENFLTLKSKPLKEYFRALKISC